MIDWSRVEELRSEIGEEGFCEIVELFLEEVEGVLRRLGTAPDPARYEDDMHFLKGSAWNLGFRAFGALCQEAERQAAAGSGARIDLAAILESYARSRQDFMVAAARICGRCGNGAA